MTTTQRKRPQVQPAPLRSAETPLPRDISFKRVEAAREYLPAGNPARLPQGSGVFSARNAFLVGSLAVLAGGSYLALKKWKAGELPTKSETPIETPRNLSEESKSTGESSQNPSEEPESVVDIDQIDDDDLKKYILKKVEESIKSKKSDSDVYLKALNETIESFREDAVEYPNIEIVKSLNRSGPNTGDKENGIRFSELVLANLQDIDRRVVDKSLENISSVVSAYNALLNNLKTKYQRMTQAQVSP